MPFCAADTACDLTIQIVSWNTCEQTLACIESIKLNSSDRYRFQVLVIDNASSDSTVERVAERYPEVRLIVSESNLGFGRANNVGLRDAKGKVVLFLNSDAEITPGFIDDLLGEFEANPEMSALGCKILGEDGFPQKSIRGFPTIGAHLYSDTVIGVLGLFRKSYNRYRLKDFDFDRSAPVSVAMGAALAFRKAIADELQGFDERFFMYFEEADLCKRLGDVGGTLCYSPKPVVKHIGGVSAKKDKARMMFVFRQSMFEYFRKHEPGWKVFLFEWTFKPLFLIQVASDALLNLLKSKVRGGGRESGGKDYRRYQVKRDFLATYFRQFLSS